MWKPLDKNIPLESTEHEIMMTLVMGRPKSELFDSLRADTSPVTAYVDRMF